MCGTEKLERKSWSLPVSARAGASNPHDRAGVNVYSTRPNTGHRKEREKKKEGTKHKGGWVKEEETLERESEHVPPSMCDVFADGIKENPAASHHFSPEISDWSHTVPTELLSFPITIKRTFLNCFYCLRIFQREKKNTTYELPYYTNLHSEIYCLNWKSSPAVGPFHRNQKGKEVVVYLNCLYLQQELHILRGTKFFIVWSIKKKRRNS